MSASGRADGSRMQIFESDEMPPPIPFNCRPFGSGLPIAARKIGSQEARSGKSFRWNITARLVPPRMNTAGRASSDILVLLSGQHFIAGGTEDGTGRQAREARRSFIVWGERENTPYASINFRLYNHRYL